VSKKVNRYLWMAIFFIGIFISIWLEWLAKTASPMAWFLISGVWSAVCGIGFTVSNIFARASLATPGRQKPLD